jgi:hypothetical protein
MRVFRWHVERLDKDQPGEVEHPTEIHVGILPATEEGERLLCSGDAQGIPKLAGDDLAWWQDEEAELEGRTTAEALLQAVVERNVETMSEGDMQRASVRGVVEEMVLLQVVSVAKRWDVLWMELSHSTGLPDVSGLIGVESKWLDFTRQARAMAGRIYRQAMEGGRQNA